jgi:hypothetical protein
MLVARSELARGGRVGLAIWVTSLLAPLAHAESSGKARAHPVHGTSEPDAHDEKSSASLFIDLEWRVYGLGQHVSHGPALAAGVSLLDDHFRVGFGGLARPGPFNPRTFDVTLQEGTEYRGQATVSLRNDGMMGGVHLSYSTELPFARGFAFQVPVTLGYGGFGYYLTGGDRDTPDGRRVSEWEDELFDGKDAYIGFVFDAAVRLRYRSRALPWLMPYAGVGFTMVPGFTTVVRDDYLGVSGLLGVEMGAGR